MKIFVITPVYNARHFVERSITSVSKQTYPDVQHIIIDDASTDGTTEVVQKSRAIVILNKTRGGSPLASTVAGIKKAEEIGCQPDDVIAIVDGDDWLNDNEALSKIARSYEKKDVWFVYSQYRPSSGKYKNLCARVENVYAYRKSNQWCVSHLKTFRKKAWDAIKDDDLRDDDGEYFKAAGDAAYVYPLLEICGDSRVRFLNEILYVYNDTNPLNEMKLCSQKQLSIAEKIKNKPIYETKV